MNTYEHVDIRHERGDACFFVARYVSSSSSLPGMCPPPHVTCMQTVDASEGMREGGKERENAHARAHAFFQLLTARGY
jgi:hypothetical protein